MDDPTLKEIENLSQTDICLEKVISSLSDKARDDLSGKLTAPDAWKSFLDQLEEDIRPALKNRKDPERAIQALNTTIFGRYQFRVDHNRLSESPIDSLLLNSVVRTRKGNCLTLSLFYLFLSERIGLRLDGMILPGHFFIRTHEHDSHRNIESTSYGMAFPDEYYKKRFARGPYLSEPKVLTRKQVVAVYLNSLATLYKYHGHYDRAIAMFETSVRIMPDSPGFLTNLGNAWERRGQIVKAESLYKKGLSLDPYAAEAHYNLGLLYFVYGRRYDLAIHHGNVARELGFQLDPTYRDFLEKSNTAIKNNTAPGLKRSQSER